MKVYLASRFARKEEMKNYRVLIQKHGHVVTSRWLDVDDSSDPSSGAVMDLEDVSSSDVVLCFTEDNSVGYNTGGRHVEAGFAIGIGVPVCVVGPRENIFYHHPSIVRFSSLDDAIVYIT